MQFHLMHFAPNSQVHGMLGYAEVIESVRWGLTELGHDVSVKLNALALDRTNIIFGAQMFDEQVFSRLPPNSIAYNFEQIASSPVEKIRPSMHYMAQHLQIWDYNAQNIETWHKLNPACQPKLVPVGWSPTLRRIPKRQDEDIDALFYGITGTERLRVFDALCRAGIKCVYACGLYGASRDDLIARSKLVLNLNVQEINHVFEIVRVSYLLANGKAVVSDVFPDTSIEEDMKEAVAFAKPDGIVNACIKLLSDNSTRSALAVRGQAIMERRDIRPILQATLSS